jgi:hypothetical protein
MDAFSVCRNGWFRKLSFEVALAVEAAFLAFLLIVLSALASPFPCHWHGNMALDSFVSPAITLNRDKFDPARTVFHL